jgi:hypothetical protein
VHRRILPGCSFVADHSGCFLTYPGFSIEVNAIEDCTIPCGTVPLGSTYGFDSRRFTTPHSSTHDVQRSLSLRLLSRPHQAQLVALRKYRAHLDPLTVPSMLPSPSLDKDAPSTAPTRPVYSVPELGSKAIERVSSYNLKRMFSCRTLGDWRMLDCTGSGLKVYHEGKTPLSIGDMVTIT